MNSKSCFFAAINLLLSSMVLGDPLPQSTKLDMPEAFLQSDPESAKHVIALDVFRDSQDQNLYYYIPPWRIRQYSRGAASPFLNVLKIGHYADAKTYLLKKANYLNSESERRAEYDRKWEEKLSEFERKKREYDLGKDEYNAKKLVELETRVNRYKVDVDKYQDLLNNAAVLGNPDVIKIWQDALNRALEPYNLALDWLNDAIKIVKNGGSLMTPYPAAPEKPPYDPPSASKLFDELIVSNLNMAGAGLSYAEINFPETFKQKLDEAIERVENYNGGILAINAYAGFTEEQLDAIKKYKAQYAPDIKIALLPIDNFTFFGLKEVKNGDDNVKGMFNMLSGVTGAGDYLGAAISADVSVAGGYSFAQHLGPFILPVGIKASFVQELRPSEAELACDFTNGFSVNGRTDVRDGLIIYDNDITTKLIAKDHSEGACDIKNIKGDPASIYFEALRELESTFETMRLSRIQLSHAEKEKYYKNVLADVQNNRAPENSGSKSNLLGSFLNFGLAGLIIDGLSSAAEFHWHTNIQDVENLSSVKFTKKIAVAGHKTVERYLPTNLCLVFNPERQSYDRCTEEELKEALDMQKATIEARNSPECKDVLDPFECGKNRDQNLKRVNRTNINDAYLELEI